MFGTWASETGLSQTETGASANMIAAISGHKTLREVQRYTDEADRRRMARQAMDLKTATFGKDRKRNG